MSVSYHPSVPRDLQTRGIISAPFPSPSLAPYLPFSPLHPRHGEGERRGRGEGEEGDKDAAKREGRWKALGREAEKGSPSRPLPVLVILEEGRELKRACGEESHGRRRGKDAE